MDRHSWFVRKLIVGSVTLAFLFHPVPVHADKCLSYEPAVVELTGFFFADTSIGTKGPEQRKREKKASGGLDFFPDDPPCVNADPVSGAKSAKTSDTFKLRVVSAPKETDGFTSDKQHVSRTVIVKGYLSPPPSGARYSPLRLKVISIKPLLTETDKCLSYEPSVVTLTGTMYEQTLPGRPNFESIEEGDEPITYWFLKPKNPICVYADTNSDINSDEKDVSDVRLFFMRKDLNEYELYKNLLSKKVTARGTLSHGAFVYDWAQIVLEVKSIEPNPVK